VDPGKPEAYRFTIPTVQYCMKKDSSVTFLVTFVVIYKVSV